MLSEVERYILEQFRNGANITLFIESETKEEAKQKRDAAPINDIKDNNEGREYFSASQFFKGRKSLLTVLSRYKKATPPASSE